MSFFLYAGFLLAIADWIATARNAQSVRWVTKPGAILGLLLWFATSTPVAGSPQITWFTLALCLSLVGDIFLLMKGYQLIKGGLAFMLAHIAFILAYNIQQRIPTIFLAIFIVNLIPAILFFRRILGEIQSTGDSDLAIGVSVYALTLTSMTSSAVSTLFRPGWPPIATWLTFLGALLFFTSNLLRFSSHFLRPKPDSEPLTMITYHLGQYALTYGFLWYLYS